MGVGWTSIGALSEVWVGGRRVAGSDSDWGEHLRTTGSGPRTTLDLGHVRHSKFSVIDTTYQTWMTEKRAKETVDSPSARNQIGLKSPQRCPLILCWSVWFRVAVSAHLECHHPFPPFHLKSLSANFTKHRKLLKFVRIFFFSGSLLQKNRRSL